MGPVYFLVLGGGDPFAVRVLWLLGLTRPQLIKVILVVNNASLLSLRRWGNTARKGNRAGGRQTINGGNNPFSLCRRM